MKQKNSIPYDYNAIIRKEEMGIFCIFFLSACSFYREKKERIKFCTQRKVEQEPKARLHKGLKIKENP